MGTTGQVDLLRPARLHPDALEAVYVDAWAFDQRLPVERATLRIDGSEIAAVAVGIERPDVVEHHRTGPWRSSFAASSGLLFAGVVGPFEPGPRPMVLEVEMADGSRAIAASGEAFVSARRAPAPAVLPDVDLAIVMATFDPPTELFERQVASIRAQDHPSWSCIVCDDGSSPERLDAMRAVLGDDERFVLVENDRRLGFYLNFERGLELVPDTVRHVALADQDDVWYEHKLSRQTALLDADPDVQLVGSDARVVDAEGRTVAPTFYTHRAPTHIHPYSLFVVNSFIGASMVFRRQLLDVALPFPRAFPNRFHDHWLARSALVTGSVGFVGEPLHDYVQHGTNVFGSRKGIRWPMRPAVKAVVKRWFGAGVQLPAEWFDYFVDTPLEASVSARLLRARAGATVELSWLDRVSDLTYGQMLELSHILVDHARERCSRRPRRESVEYAQFTGRSWMMAHAPGAVAW